MWGPQPSNLWSAHKAAAAAETTELIASPVVQRQLSRHASNGFEQLRPGGIRVVGKTASDGSSIHLTLPSGHSWHGVRSKFTPHQAGEVTLPNTISMLQIQWSEGDPSQLCFGRFPTTLFTFSYKFSPVLQLIGVTIIFRLESGEQKIAG